MGLDDIADDAKDEAEEKKINKVADELGIDGREELEELDDRLSVMASVAVSQDKELENLRERVNNIENRISNVETLLREVIKMVEQKDKQEEEDGN